MPLDGCVGWFQFDGFSTSCWVCFRSQEKEEKENQKKKKKQTNKLPHQ
jgi:hypothetical protein